MRTLRPAGVEILRPAFAPALCALSLGVLCGCQPGNVSVPGPISFDSASVWVHTRLDSVPLLVEIARTEAQHELGLSGRPMLDPESGMLFEFDDVRSGDDGFWMWRTLIPLDIAFVDRSGLIVRILSMDSCDLAAGDEECPGHFPGVGYSAAIETNRGWFAEKGITEGSRVRVVR